MDKPTLRRLIKEWRRTLSDEQRATISQALCRELAALPLFAGPVFVLGYAPLPYEPDIRPFLKEVLRRGGRVALPTCDVATKTLTFYEIAEDQPLSVGPYGIEEPRKDPERRVTPTADMVCIVPGLAFDTEGDRLGYGGGYYDRFLPTFAGMTVGVCAEVCRVGQLPQDLNDHPVAMVVTEQGGTTCGR